MMLYFSFLTLFSPWFLEDMLRLHQRKAECGGLCCCKEDSLLFCKAKCLSKRQKQFSKLLDIEESKETPEDKEEFTS